MVLPKICKKYLNLNSLIEKAVKKYTRDVKMKRFPSIKNFFKWIKEKDKEIKLRDKLVYFLRAIKK